MNNGYTVSTTLNIPLETLAKAYAGDVSATAEIIDCTAAYADAIAEQHLSSKSVISQIFASNVTFTDDIDFNTNN